MSTKVTALFPRLRRPLRLVVPAVRDALRSLCIADLAHEAEALQERERMLGEDWGRPYDPIAADRRALAREVAAANRAMRAQP